MKSILKLALGNPFQRRLLCAVVLSMIILTIANALEIFAIGLLSGRGNEPEKGFLRSMWQFFEAIFPLKESLVAFALFIFSISCFKAIALFLQRYLSKTLAIEIQRDLRRQFFDHIQYLPMRFYHEFNMGALSSRVMGDAALIAESIQGVLVNCIQFPLVTLSSLIICFLTSWQLSLFIFFGLPAILLPILFLSGRVRRLSKELQKNQEFLTSVLIDFLGGIQTIKIYGIESFSRKKYVEYSDKISSLEKRSAKYDVLSRPLVHTIAMLFLVTTLFFGLFFLHLDIAEVLFFSGMLYLFYEPMKKFAEENSHIQRGLAAKDRLEEILHFPIKPEEEGGDLELNSFNHEIEFRDIWFRYKENWVLKGVSFTIKKGEFVALAGPTGSGKSTIVNLLVRLWEPERGEILIDGVPIKAFRLASLRRKMAFVAQKPFLFLDTICANICLGSPFSDAEVIEALKQAHAYEFVERLQKGIHTETEEGGKNFSGGQQQRLALARALIKRGFLLIMDEATSALDPLSEFYVRETLDSLRKTTTQLVIAHRLPFIQKADKVLFLEGGQVTAEGTFQELSKRSASFQRMCELFSLEERKEKG